MNASVSISGPDTVPVCILQVRRANDAHLAALSKAFETTWPAAPNVTARAGQAVIAWLSPGEWALLGMEANEAGRRAGAALGDTLHLLADVTDGRALFTLDGPGARALLAKGCSLDLHRRRFPPQSCAQTLLAQCDIFLHRPGDTDRFEILVDAPLAAHLKAWFDDASLEFAD
jgi:sarcosine oxidase subunit gamma